MRATTEFCLAVNQHAFGGPKMMVYAYRVVVDDRSIEIVSDGWFEEHRLHAISPTGVNGIRRLLAERERGKLES